ncbi:MAG: Nif11-like leader peptide family RiPP precursor [Eubacteriales bacterium]|nr:Nif11-like leader peptide family RiPP precursor [Eubacteriales bacterium]
MEELVRFNSDVAKSQEMQEEIKAIDQDLSKIVEYANKKGYQFSLTDVENAMKNNAKLSEEQLDHAAGGGAAVGPSEGIFPPSMRWVF